MTNDLTIEKILYARSLAARIEAAGVQRPGRQGLFMGEWCDDIDAALETWDELSTNNTLKEG